MDGDTAPVAPDAARRRVLYGRRKGRPLRPGQKRLLRDLLPRIAVAPDPLSGPVEPPSLFGVEMREAWLEIGFGAGEHLAAQAAARRDIGIIGCEPYINGVVRLLSEIESQDLTNVRILMDDARDLLPRLPDASITRAFVLFPDPWPKFRHAKRRFISDVALEQLARIIAPGGELRIATDDPGYLCWVLEHMRRYRDSFAWLAERPDDWRRRPEDWPPTRYEQKALREERKCTYLRYRRPLA